MKSKLLIIGFLCVVLCACKETTESKMETAITEEVSLDQPNLRGTWELVGFYNYQECILIRK